MEGHDVEGKNMNFRKQAAVKRGKQDKKIKSEAPFSWTVPWV